MRRARAAAAAALLVLTACAAERTDRVANAVAALNVPTTTATSQAPVRPAPPGQDNCTASLPPMNPLPRPGAMPAGRFMHRIQLSDEVVAASSFAPRLRRGDLVAGQYLVEGCIAHGGHGWVYLARDKHLDDSWVVLKGLLDEGDPAAAAAAIAERRFLAEVHHPNIVQIRNFVSEGGAGYIVMEYLAGKSLRELRRSEDARVMPVERAIEFVLAVLPAFEYLHSIGLLFCDFKPDNVINTVNAVRLIDLGSVHQVGGSHYTFGTVGIKPPRSRRSARASPRTLTRSPAHWQSCASTSTPRRSATACRRPPRRRCSPSSTPSTGS